MFSTEQDTTIKENDEKVIKIMSFIPEIMGVCKQYLVGSSREYNNRSDFYPHQRAIYGHCKYIYTYILENLANDNKNKITLDHSKLNSNVIGLLSETTNNHHNEIILDGKRFCDNINNAIQNEKTHPNINDDIKKQMDTAKSIITNVPYAEKCINSSHSECIELLNDIRYSIFGKNSYINKDNNEKTQEYYTVNFWLLGVKQVTTPKEITEDYQGLSEIMSNVKPTTKNEIIRIIIDKINQVKKKL